MPRRLGQHFLADRRVLERIADAVGASRNDMVIEIGAGRGALTSLLAERAGLVAAIEIDPPLVEHLRETFGVPSEASRSAGSEGASPAEAGEEATPKDALAHRARRDPSDAVAPTGRVAVIEADVLQLPLAPLPAQYGFERARVAGNLPYYITSPILTHLFAARSVLDLMVVMTQLEVARRITAVPGSRDYGLLSVSAQYFTEAELLFRIRPGAFRPPPKVDSAVVRMTPRHRDAELGIADNAAFIRFVGSCFAQKRKTVANNLKGRYHAGPVQQALNAIGAKPNARAEELSVEQLAALYRALTT